MAIVITAEDRMQRDAFLYNNRLDFNVSKRKLHLYDTKYGDDYNSTEFYCTVNDETKEALGPVRSRYTVKQNTDLLDLVLDKIGEGNYDLSQSRGGTFDKGRKVYFFIKYNMQTDWGQEEADSFVYALSSHDGSLRLTFGISNMIHSCSNMFGLLMQDKENNHVIKHTKKIDDLQNNKSLDNLIKTNLLGVSSLMKKMQNVHVGYESTITKKVMDLISDSNLKRKTSVHFKRRELIERAVIKEMNEKGSTVYGLFNGLTNYLTHSGEVSEIDYMYGSSSKITTKALELIVNHMKETGCLN